ncbi:hypothetical protein [Aestuariibaculum suncheonense]|uniref:Cytochrome c domain-containing protein n=1 Tax=Aestuariibaculum suncheonense TaxID=1028745 RepID=A0A8J6Q5J6_9FLAO|nr:hypothetical protein [Aestuariibaculum suncheonense]MBD0834130.1 hypothetical protein [Aestuariibaculum suncheonense]
MKIKSIIKKVLLLITLVFTISTLQYCKSSKETTVKKEEPAVTYTKHIAPVMERSCAPCHFPENGKKKFLDTYGAVKNNIEDIIARVELPVTEKKYMPFKSKKPALTPKEIAMLKQWVASGYSE